MVTKKREDTAEGCRSLALDDRLRAVEAANPRMRSTLERSAMVWTSRAKLLERLEAEFNARTASLVVKQAQRRVERKDHG